MRSTGRIRTKIENASHFRQTDVIVETIVLEEKILLPRNRCHASPNLACERVGCVDSPNFRIVWGTYFHLQINMVTSQILVWEKITYFLLIFPRDVKFIQIRIHDTRICNSVSSNLLLHENCSKKKHLTGKYS